MTENDIQRVKKHINNIQKQHDLILHAIKSSNIKYDLLNAESNIEKYRRIVSNAQKYAENVIEDSIEGRGVIFKKKGFKDFINCRNKDATIELDKILDSYDNEINLIIFHLANIEKKPSGSYHFDERKYDDDKEYTDFVYTDNNNENNVYSNIYKNNVTRSFADNSYDEILDKGITLGLKDNSTKSTSVSDFYELDVRNKKKVEVKPKKIVITKHTALDSDELKEIFISRHANYSLTIDHLNKAIEVVGNNIDKDKILLEALKLRFFDYISNFDYFYCYTTLNKAIPQAIKLEKYDLALEFIFGIVCLETSGYLMAHSKWKERRNILDVFIDPSLTEKFIIQIKDKLLITNNEVYQLYINSSFVRELITSMPHPLFTLENSAKIMVMVYENPQKRYECNELGLSYNE